MYNKRIRFTIKHTHVDRCTFHIRT